MNNQIDYEINKELGECYLFMGEYEKSRDYYQKAVACDEGKSDPFMGLAAIALTEGNMKDALTYYSRANALSSTDKSLAGMGMVEAELGMYELAYEHFTLALMENPASMIAINGIVQLGYHLNRLEKIIPYLSAALEVGADDQEAVRYALAGCLMALGQDDESKVQLEILLGANPLNDKAQQLYARFAA